MTQRKTIVLPARLVGVVRASETPVPPFGVLQPEPEPPVVIDHAAQEREQVQQILARLAARIEQLRAAQPSVEELQHAAVALGIAIASRLVFHQIAAGAFGIEELVRGALAQLHTTHATVVHLHPEDLALLQERLGDPATLHAEQPVQWRADASLARGDCKVQADDLGVWSNMQQRLQQLRAVLLEQVQTQSEPRP